MRGLIAGMLLALAGSCFAGTITVTSPSDGDYLGRSNTVRFNITNAEREVTVRVRAESIDDPSVIISVEDRVTPSTEGNASGSINLNFDETTPEGDWTITVRATEAGATYNEPAPIPVVVDVTDPKILNFSPLSGSFVKGVVPITVELDEPNMKEWRVRINNADIPGNSGTSESFIVNWNANSVPTDGQRTINLSIEDLANNRTNSDITVTIDRIPPSSNILAPTSSTVVRPETDIAVVVDVTDQFQNSLDFTGIDVFVERMDGTFFGRVARRNVNTNGNTLTFSGRIQSSRNLPNNFRIVVRAVDKAGNEAVVQKIEIDRNRGRAVNTTPPASGGNSGNGSSGSGGAVQNGNGLVYTGGNATGGVWAQWLLQIIRGNR